jgi:hypothetical protein
MAVANIKGPRGPVGPPGSQIFVGVGAPHAGSGNVNDVYIDTSGSNLWKKTASTVWELFGSFAGPSGTAGALQGTKTAVGDILTGECLRIINSTKVALADPTLDVMKAIVFGIAMNDAINDADVDVLTAGPIFNEAYRVFAPNKLLFLDEGGGLTDVRRTTKFNTVVAKSLGDGWIYVKPEIPHVLGD